MMRLACLCLMLLVWPHVSTAEERMGRLFLTPAERGNLEFVRQSSKPPDRVIKPESEMVEENGAPVVSPTVSSVTMQGYVKRSDGKGTVWVNHQPLRETSSQGEIQVGKVHAGDGKVSIKLSGTAKEVALKAGQIYDPATGAVVEHSRDLPSPAVPETAPVSGKTAPPVPAADPAKKP